MPAISHVTASCRRLESAQGLRGLEVQWPGRLRLTTLDVTNEKSIENASSAIPGGTPPLRVLFNCAGVLHSSDLQPEKRLSDVRITALRQYFDVNAIGPLLVLKHFKRHLAATGRVVIGNVSARVGSIGDNRLGGWYGYRAGKAAQNMFTKNIAIELARSNPETICVGLHPGTVKTDLSAPFTKKITTQLFEPDEAAQRLISVLSGLTPADSGLFFDYRGERIDW
jgi:NAD(P)-dependent dehydrogenase (short-subunit alcohol dehydrogenase family)